tara:strand:+ start:715 stop:2541 length:1827 start_codon:yes stop_codon:yes gene_type:complete
MIFTKENTNDNTKTNNINFNMKNKKFNNNNGIVVNRQSHEIVDFHNNIKYWLSNPNKSFYNLNNNVRLSEYNFFISKKIKKTNIESGKIILIQQFYIPNDKSRLKELQETLKYNCHNNLIEKIVLLNERIYTDEELGTNDNKIEQINLAKRITYKDVLNYSNKLKDEVFIVLANSDIFFDASIGRVKESGLSSNKKAFTLLRHEFENNLLKDCKLFGPRAESQDCWIWNSKWKIPDNLLKIFDIELGMPGCDNKIVYLLLISGFTCHNEPHWIKCYHNHKTIIRNYKNVGLKQPYYAIFPLIEECEHHSDNNIFDPIQENTNLKYYIKNKMDNNKHFIIPRIAGIENELSFLGICIAQNKSASQEQIQYIKSMIPTMKKNAGVMLTDINAVCNYSMLYLSAFKKSDCYFWWAPWGNVAIHIANSYDFILDNFKEQKIDALTLDIFNNIHNDPWTLSLRGKRILIISSFTDSIKEKINIREKIYGIDLFPECEFIFLTPPQTHGENISSTFDIEFNTFVTKIHDIKDSFDVALCSCGGYGNPICSVIYDMGKSAIYVGGVLQMYFGIYGERWMRERPEILRAYMNEHWSRPKNSEKPKNNKEIEGNCYW